MGGRGAELLALRRGAAAGRWGSRYTHLAYTKLSVLRGLRRCGWLPGPDDADVAKAVAWLNEEAQNWRDYLEDGSYEEEKCRKIIERYERRLAFFRDWELAMQREGWVLVRILAGAPRDRASAGHLPVLAARLVAAFAVREPAPEAAEAWPEPIDAAPPSSEEATGQDQEDAAAGTDGSASLSSVPLLDSD